jgi:hypothetical protein
VMRQHKLNFSNSPLNNSEEVFEFSGELGGSLSPDTEIGASLLKPTSLDELKSELLRICNLFGVV